jgi:molecular chaperone DnaK
VSAKDLGTGKENKIRIEQSSGLNQAEIDKMKRDAELHADEDKNKREFAEARNEADNKLFQVEKVFKEAGDKLGEADKAPIQKAMDRVKDAMKGSDLNALKSSLSDLDTASAAMAQHMQGQAGAGPGPEAAPSGGKKGGDDVIDAEYEVKK